MQPTTAQGKISGKRSEIAIPSPEGESLAPSVLEKRVQLQYTDDNFAPSQHPKGLKYSGHLASGAQLLLISLLGREELEAHKVIKLLLLALKTGSQPWMFTGSTDAEAEAPILWPPDAKSWLIRKDPDAEKDWGQEEKGPAEDEMVR